jgi:hypothetical protein
MTLANSMSILKGTNWRDARWTLALRNWSECSGFIVRLKALAPYALIELVLPGGSVMALLLWIYRRRKNRTDSFGPFTAGLGSYLRWAIGRAMGKQGRMSAAPTIATDSCESA